MGLIAGAIAKAITKSGGGWVSTLIVGVIGGIVGGWIGAVLFDRGITGFLHTVVVAAGHRGRRAGAVDLQPDHRAQALGRPARRPTEQRELDQLAVGRPAGELNAGSTAAACAARWKRESRRLDRDEHSRAHLVGVAPGDQPQHLPLALAEPVEILVDAGHVDRNRRRRPGRSRPAR